MADKLYVKPEGAQSRWSSFENPKGEKGGAAKENQGSKGHAFDKLCAGETQILLDYKGAGIIQRMWFTLTAFIDPVNMRSLVLRCYWDGCEKPAVEAPLGDFIPVGDELLPFENELFSSPEGRSVNIYIPMPFKTGARITLTNESKTFDLVHLFYDINFTALDRPEEGQLYFHSWWNRENPTRLREDYQILPQIRGRGRFLGVAMVVNANFNHPMWWGEGEFKVYIDGDTDHPTLCGTGAEDYVGTGWGLGKFIGRYQGCTRSDGENRRWAFYRFHVPDPIYFDADIKVTLQQLGGGMGQEVRSYVNQNARIIPVSYDNSSEPGGFRGFMEEGYDASSDAYDKYWVNFYREDDIAATAYFYLDQPVNTLPSILSLEKRLEGMVQTEKKMERKDI